MQDDFDNYIQKVTIDTKQLKNFKATSKTELISLKQYLVYRHIQLFEYLEKKDKKPELVENRSKKNHREFSAILTS